VDTPDLTTTKRCTKCGETKPRDQFNRQKDKKDGLCSHCKACKREHRQENAEQNREYNRKYYRENSEQLREYAREYQQAHAGKRHEYNREYWQQNAERLSEQKREYYQRNIERIRKYRQDNADRIREQARRYRQTPGGKAANTATSQRRRARKRSLPNTFSSADWQHAVEYFGGCCAICGRPPGLWHTLAADHWIPISRGGPTAPDNIVPTCHGVNGCNNVRRNKLPAEWLIEKFGTRKGRAILKRIEAFLDSRRPEV